MKNELGLCLLGALLLAASGCSREEQNATRERRRYVAGRRDIVELCREDGTLKAVKSIAIYPEIMGERLVEVPVRRGDRVEKGQVLYRYATNSVSEALQETQAVLKARRLNRRAAKQRLLADRLAARQDLLATKQEFEALCRNLETQRQLMQEGLASSMAYQSASSAVAVASLKLELASQRVDDLHRGEDAPEVAELDAQILQLERRGEQLLKQLDQCTGQAPFAGRVVSINEQIDPLIDSLADIRTPLAMGGEPLVTLSDTSRMRVIGKFFESDIARIRVGQPVRITVPHVPGDVFDGKVVSVGQQGKSQGHIATVAVEAEVPNEEGLLKPGLSGEMKIVVGRADGVLAIPVEYLRDEDGQLFVLRERDGQLTRTVVKTGLSDDRFVEIRSGLNAGDTVVME